MEEALLCVGRRAPVVSNAMNAFWKKEHRSPVLIYRVWLSQVDQAQYPAIARSRVIVGFAADRLNRHSTWLVHRYAVDRD